MKPLPPPSASGNPSTSTSGVRRGPVLAELLIGQETTLHNLSFEPNPRAPVGGLPQHSPLLSPGCEIFSELASPSEALPKSPQDLVGEMRNLLRDGDSEKRKHMIGAIVSLANTHQDGVGAIALDMIAGPEFLAVACDRDRYVRLAVVDALHCLSASQIPVNVCRSLDALLRPEFQALLADPEEDIRQHMLGALIGFARHNRSDVAARAQQVILNPVIPQLLRDRSPEVRREAFALVQRVAKSPRPDLAAQAAQLLQECRR